MRIAEANYHALGNLIREHRTTSQACQDLLASKGLDPLQGHRISDVENHIGFALRERLRSLVEAIDVYLSGGAGYTSAITELHASLVAIFGKRGILRAELKNFERA